MSEDIRSSEPFKLLIREKNNIEDYIRKNDYLIYQYENRIKKIEEENITLEKKRQDYIKILNSPYSNKTTL